MKQKYLIRFRQRGRDNWIIKEINSEGGDIREVIRYFVNNFYARNNLTIEVEVYKYTEDLVVTI